MTWKLQDRSRIIRFDETLQRLDFINAEYIDGKLAKTFITKDSFQANVQPLNGRELLLVPEHQRFIEQYWCYVGTDLQINTGDLVHRDNVHYQVQSVEYWGSYQRVRIMRVDTGQFQTP